MDQRVLKLLVGLLVALVPLSPMAAAGGATVTYLEPHAGCASTESNSTQVEENATARREKAQAERHESCASGRTILRLSVDEPTAGTSEASVDETRSSDSSRASAVQNDTDADGTRSRAETDSTTASRNGYAVSASGAGRDTSTLLGCRTSSSVAGSSSSETGTTTRSSNETFDDSDSLCGVHAKSGATALAAGVEGGCSGRTSNEKAGTTLTRERTGACRDGVAVRGPVSGFAGIESGIRETCRDAPESSSCAGQVYHSLTVETSLGPGVRVPLPLGLLRLVLP